MSHKNIQNSSECGKMWFLVKNLNVVLLVNPQKQIGSSFEISSFAFFVESLKNLQQILKSS